jgi:hypothetical protein
VLQGHSRRKITLNIDLAHLAKQNEDLVLPFEAVLRPLMKDRSTADWTVTGRVRLPFALPAGHIDLGEINGETRKGEFQLQRHPLVSEIDVAAISGLTVSLVRRGERGEPDRYEVIRSHEVPLGPFRTRLRFTGTARDGTATSPIDVVASGLWAGDFSWTPHQLLLTSDRSGSRGELIVIRSRSDSPVVVERAASSSKFVELELIPSADESCAAVRVRLRNDTTDGINVTTKILISVRNSAGPEDEVIEVPVIAYSPSPKETRATAKR